MGLVHTVHLNMCAQFHLICVHIVADVAHIGKGSGGASFGTARGGRLSNNIAVTSTFELTCGYSYAGGSRWFYRDIFGTALTVLCF